MGVYSCNDSILFLTATNIHKEFVRLNLVLKGSNLVDFGSL
ncbi:hypothetical protein Gotur_007254 [Gossypium turneri]